MNGHDLRTARTRITRVPYLSSGVLLKTVASSVIERSDADPRVLTATASGAIFLAIRALGLTANDVVLCPAYNCGHEVEAVLRAAPRVAFYSIDRDLKFSLDDIERRVDDSVRAILVTHFFGVSVPLDDLAAFCKSRSLFLIEDCAHLLPDGPGGPGGSGDVAVYSLRKLLPLPDGGILRINNPAVPLPVPAASPQFLAGLLELGNSFYATPDAGVFAKAAQVALRLGLKAPLRLVRWLLPDRNWDYVGSNSLDYPTEHLDLGMSSAAHRAMGYFDWPKVCALRRRNFRTLLDRFPYKDSFRPLIRSLDTNDCPLVFPVQCQDAEGFLSTMNHHGVPATAWWPTPMHTEVPWDQFEVAADLKRSVCALPIHQDLRTEHIERILATLSEA